jgi:hypothetical protein
LLGSVEEPNEKKKLVEAMQRRPTSRLFAAIQELLTMKARILPYDVTACSLSLILFVCSETRRFIQMRHSLGRAKFIVVDRLPARM